MKSLTLKWSGQPAALAFFGFLRCSEMTVPTDSAYDPSTHLSISDIQVDHPSSPTVLQVNIKSSKTDPFRKGIHLYLGETGCDLCPVAAVVAYLCIRGMKPGPLFMFSDGRYLTRQRFVNLVRSALEESGINYKLYCSHSFRIGAATTAAAQGIEDSVIKTLGRWESAAYLRYVKIPRSQLASYSGILTSP